MKITVTGGTGFVGLAVIKALAATGKQLVIFTRKNIISSNPNITYVKVDYSNPKDLEKNLAGCDAVIHLAAALFCRTANEYFKANEETAKNLNLAAQKAGVKKIVYISSLAAGGPMGINQPDRIEDMQDNPVSNYGKSKLAAEKALINFPGEIVILRPPIVYGPRDEGFSKIAQWVKKGIMIVPNCDKTPFSFIYLKDLTKCIEKALYTRLPKGEKYYVCENKTYQWGEFIDEMAFQMGVKKPKMLKMPFAVLYGAGLAYEILSYIFGALPVLNRDKAREACGGKWTCIPSKWEKATGFRNWTSLKEGLKETFSQDK